ncbi:MAG: hypothetical protein RBS80_07760 [Thermoguttaceae bacterium]|jgi:hypothetical protein|nr:hypothetical protein [Thermoguttaceae bacterium]
MIDLDRLLKKPEFPRSAKCWSFHTLSWWRELWSRTACVTDVYADTQLDGWRHWRDFELAVAAAGKSPFPSDAEAIEQDAGRYLGFVRAVARRAGTPPENLYDPSVGLRAGVDA